MDLFGHHILSNPTPASTIWVNMYECEECSGDERFKIEGSYCWDPRDLEACWTHKFDPITQQEDGTITNVSFEEWMTRGLENYAKSNGIESMDMNEICKVPYKYDPVNFPYMDTGKFFNDLLTNYGFTNDLQ